MPSSELNVFKKFHIHLIFRFHSLKGFLLDGSEERAFFRPPSTVGQFNLDSKFCDEILSKRVKK